MPRLSVLLPLAVLLLPLSAGRAQAQARPAPLARYEALPPEAARWPSARPLAGGAAVIPDSARRSRGTHWVEGAVIGGGLGVLTGGILAAVFCGLSEGDDNCLGDGVAAALLLGAAGGGLGALIGAAFPKPAPAVADSTLTRH